MQRLAGFAVIGLVLSHLAPGMAAQDGWKSMTAGGMTVSIPCSADWETMKQDIPEEASVVTTHVLVCKTSDTFYLLSWSEVETKARFDGMTALRSGRDAMLKSIGGALLMTSNDIRHDGLQGIDFTGNLGDRLLLTTRSVFQGKRMYSITVGTPIQQDRSADIKRFLTSLKIAR